MEWSVEWWNGWKEMRSDGLDIVKGSVCDWDCGHTHTRTSVTKIIYGENSAEVASIKVESKAKKKNRICCEMIMAMSEW